MKFIKQLFKLSLYSFLTILGFVFIALLSFWLELKTNMTLPAPTGKYQVGRMAMHLIDSSRVDSLPSQLFTKRELLVWVWYPASAIATDSLVNYIPSGWSKALNEKRGFMLRNFFARDASKIHAHSFKVRKYLMSKLNIRFY